LCFLCWWFVCCYIVCSSRRRHTRSKRDWSSDVCSSALLRRTFLGGDPGQVLGGERAAPGVAAEQLRSPWCGAGQRGQGVGCSLGGGRWLHPQQHVLPGDGGQQTHPAAVRFVPQQHRFDRGVHHRSVTQQPAQQPVPLGGVGQQRHSGQV